MQHLGTVNLRTDTVQNGENFFNPIDSGKNFLSLLIHGGVAL